MSKRNTIPKRPAARPPAKATTKGEEDRRVNIWKFVDDADEQTVAPVHLVPGKRPASKKTTPAKTAKPKTTKTTKKVAPSTVEELREWTPGESDNDGKIGIRSMSGDIKQMGYTLAQRAADPLTGKAKTLNEVFSYCINRGRPALEGLDGVQAIRRMRKRALSLGAAARDLTPFQDFHLTLTCGHTKAKFTTIRLSKDEQHEVNTLAEQLGLPVSTVATLTICLALIEAAHNDDDYAALDDLLVRVRDALTWRVEELRRVLDSLERKSSKPNPLRRRRTIAQIFKAKGTR